MINICSFHLKSGENTPLSSLIPAFHRFHLTSIALAAKTKKKACLYAIFGDNQKILLTPLNPDSPICRVDLWFNFSQKCRFLAEGDGLFLNGHYQTREQGEDSIEDEDEFKAIAFKARKIGEKLDNLIMANKKK